MNSFVNLGEYVVGGTGSDTDGVGYIQCVAGSLKIPCAAVCMPFGSLSKFCTLAGACQEVIFTYDVAWEYSLVLGQVQIVAENP